MSANGVKQSDAAVNTDKLPVVAEGQEPPIEIRLHMHDSSELLIVKDRTIIKAFGTLRKICADQNPNWETQETIVPDVIQVRYPRFAAVFAFKNALHYQNPLEIIRDVTVDYYPEAAALTLDELKEVIELGNFLECPSFVQAIGFVIADKLKDMELSEVSEYMGIDLTGMPVEYVEEEWERPSTSGLNNQ